MELMLAILLASLAAALGYAVAIEWRRSSRDKALYRQRCRERDARREAGDVVPLLRERFGGVDEPRLRRMWDSLAKSCDIRPELMRPEDRLCDLAMTTSHYGPDCFDLQEWLQVWHPSATNARIEEIMDHEITDQSTVVEMMELVLKEEEAAAGVER